MEQFISFKLVLSGGPFNGAERYYHSYSVAIREGNKYLKKYSIKCFTSDNCSLQVFGLTSDYKCKLLYCS